MNRAVDSRIKEPEALATLLGKTPSIYRIFRLAMVLWVVLLGMSFSLNYQQAHRSAREMALNEAKNSLNKDLVYRRWAAVQGGVYVTSSEMTPPNPHLSFLAHRDVTTSAGQNLTLVNPAYMTRQVYEMGKQQYGSQGHITSLNPIRPENRADPWEKKALVSFRSNKEDVSSFEMIDGRPFLRYMRPMITEKSCLRCHAKQGYEIGDIRGGIGVSVPLAPYLSITRNQLGVFALGHGILGLLGLLGLWLGGRKVAYSLKSRNEMEDRLLKSNAELLRSNAELKQFAYVATHDLQEPLRKVASYMELVAERYSDQLDQDAREFIEYAVDGARRMKMMINDLLAYSRVGTKGKMLASVDLTKILQDVKNELEPIIRENDAVVSFDALPAVRAEKAQLQQLFRNLIGNALKYRGDDPPQILVWAERQAQAWQICVQDNGIGIDPHFFKRIFQIFRRLHSRDRYEGTGIGLALCKKIVEHHGGTMMVESTPGHGSTFSFLIPDQQEMILDERSTGMRK